MLSWVNSGFEPAKRPERWLIHLRMEFAADQCRPSTFKQCFGAGKRKSRSSTVQDWSVQAWSAWRYRLSPEVSTFIRWPHPGLTGSPTDRADPFHACLYPLRIDSHPTRGYLRDTSTGPTAVRCLCRQKDVSWGTARPEGSERSVDCGDYHGG
jgi:hypothetical protein